MGKVVFEQGRVKPWRDLDNWEKSAVWVLYSTFSFVLKFSRQDYWHGLPFLTPGDLSDPRDQSLISCIAGRFLTVCAKVGSQETPGVTGKFGLGIWNEAGQRLIEFCQENALVIANTLFHWR